MEQTAFVGAPGAHSSIASAAISMLRGSAAVAPESPGVACGAFAPVLATGAGALALLAGAAISRRRRAASSTLSGPSAKTGGQVQKVVATSQANAGYVGRFDGTQKTVSSAEEEAAAAEGTKGRTAARWSILSERIEGLAKEMYMLVGSQDPYLRSMSTAEGPAMEAIREKMASTDWAGLWESKTTMFSYGAEMSTDPVEAQFVKMLTYMKSPKSVLEIGMFTGYGAMAIAEALGGDGKLTSLDIDPYLKTWVEEVTSKFPEGAKHEIVVGPALDSLQVIKPSAKYDMVFIDANKAEYKAYVETLLERDLVTKDVMIVADNVLYVGYPYLSDTYDTQPARRGFGDAVREFNLWVRDHPRLEQVILPIRDGVSMIRLKD